MMSFQEREKAREIEEKLNLSHQIFEGKTINHWILLILEELTKRVKGLENDLKWLKKGGHI
jgi:hypothetical protein